jgi:hypothetical protein
MDDVVKLIEAINTTPFRTIALVVGFIALSIGYGLKIRAVIDVESINKTYARIVGIVLLILGFMLFLPDITTQPGLTDPFLPYYIVSVIVVTIFSALTLKLTTGQTQIKAMKGLFLLVAVLVTFVVIWRGIADYFHVIDPGHTGPPLGFNLTGGNFLPYFILLSAGIGVLAWLIYKYTKQLQDSENRILIFKYFFLFCIYLGACRIAWEVIDKVARKVIAT